MGVERVDYSTEDEFQQALQAEEYEEQAHEEQRMADRMHFEQEARAMEAFEIENRLNAHFFPSWETCRELMTEKFPQPEWYSFWHWQEIPPSNSNQHLYGMKQDRMPRRFSLTGRPGHISTQNPFCEFVAPSADMLLRNLPPYTHLIRRGSSVDGKVNNTYFIQNERYQIDITTDWPAEALAKLWIDLRSSGFTWNIADDEILAPEEISE